MTGANRDMAIQEVRAACDQMVDGERNKNWDTVRPLIWDDAVWLPPNADPVVGVAAIQSLFEEFFEIPFTDMSVDIRDVQASESGDLASVWGTFALEIDSPDGVVTESMSFLMTWEKRAGEWRAATNMYSSNSPPAA